MALENRPVAGTYGHYETIGRLGQGSFGAVYLAKDTTNDQLFALKFIERDPQADVRYIEREIFNHMRLRHPNIISLHGCFSTREHLVLVLEFAAGGSLFASVQRSGGLEELEARRLFQQIVLALSYCHGLGLFHRDIKLENTLLDGSPPLVKLCDFGLSKDAIYHSAPRSRVGSPKYYAPEVLNAGEGATYDGAAADVWSCGVLLYVMVCGAYPFPHLTGSAVEATCGLKDLLEGVTAGAYSFPDDRWLTPEFKNLIARMLVVQPAKRATLQEVMAHPWCTVDRAQLDYNESLVKNSQENPLPRERMVEIAEMVAQSRH